MQESTAERWQLILVLTFLGLVIAGVYWANRNPSDAAPSLGQSKPSSLASPPPKSRAQPKKLRRSTLASADKKTSTTGTQPQDLDQPDHCTPSVERMAEAPPSLAVTEQLGEAFSSFDGSTKGAQLALEVIERVRKTNDETHTSLLESYRSYFLRALGEPDEAERALERARARFPMDACNQSLSSSGDQPKESPIRIHLRAIRLALETTWSPGGSSLLACRIFRLHPGDAGDAFGVLWGDERDGAASAMKRSCITQLLENAPSHLLQETVTARNAICSEMTGVLRGPPGPVARVLEIATCDFLDDVVLSPERWTRNGEPEVRRLLDESTQRDPALTSRLRRYEGVVAAREVVLGKAIGFMLDSEGHDAPLPDCRRRARQAAFEGLAARLSTLLQSETVHP
jgi:hypothetical protein